jgi:hypothetical protein
MHEKRHLMSVAAAPWYILYLYLYLYWVLTWCSTRVHPVLVRKLDRMTN